MMQEAQLTQIKLFQRLQLNFKNQAQEIDTCHQQGLKEAKEALAIMTKQIKELQDMEQMAKDEKENASKWRNNYRAMEQEHSTTLQQSREHQQRANNAEDQVKAMAQAITEATEKAQKDAQEIKEL